jgi:hypothetical protein
MAKGSGNSGRSVSSVRQAALRAGTKLRPLSQREINANGGRYKYAIGKDGRARNLSEASRIIAGQRAFNLRNTTISSYLGGTFQVSRNVGGGVSRLVGQFRTRREATAFAARGAS